MPIILTPATDITRQSYIDTIRSLIKDSVVSPTVSLSKSSGGSLAAGNVNVRVSAVTDYGETIPSNRISITVLADDKVSISIGRVPDAKYYRVYASAGTDTETLQAEVDKSQAGNATYSLTSIATGTAMPTVDTATIYASKDNYENALESAVGEYSLNFPQELNETIALTTNLNYALPAAFVDGFSSIRKIIYPGDSDPEDWLDPRDYTARAGYVYLQYPLTAGETMIVRYTALHTVSDASSSVPDHHFAALCLLAASYICLEIAVKYAHASNKNIGADTVDYKMRASDFRSNAKSYRDKAEDILGLKNGIKASSAVANWGWYEDR